MHNSQERGLTMSRPLLMRGCKIIKGRWIERVGGLPMVQMDLLMEMVYKPLVEVHTK
jgi:hypothetical protein